MLQMSGEHWENVPQTEICKQKLTLEQTFMAKHRTKQTDLHGTFL